MKKIALTLALVTLVTAVNAQSLNVTSARESINRGYYEKAKKQLEPALEHEQTKNDAKTWYYAALLYSHIYEESQNPRSKYKNLDPDALEKCKNAALRCKELDTEAEHAEGNNTILGYAGNEYYKKAINAFKANQWDSCMMLCEESIKLFNESGKKEFASESYLLAGKAAMNASNQESIIKYFNPLVRLRTKENLVYRTLFNTYKSSGDTNAALTIAQSYVKNCKNDYNANMMMAEAYFLKGNMEKGSEEIQKAIDKTEDPAVRAQVLAIAGATLEESNPASAEARYKESLQIEPNQYVANYGMAIITYNKVVDKIQNIPLDDETGLYETTKKEYNDAIPYLLAAISYIDNIVDDATRNAQVNNLFHALNALNKVYTTLEMYEEAKPVKARIAQIQKNNQ